MEIETYLERKVILSRIAELADELVSLGKHITSMTILKGAKTFSQELRNELDKRGVAVTDYEIRLSSYKGTKSSGKVNLHTEMPEEVMGKDILIIEDIVDTGTTLHFFREQLQKEGVKSVKICSLLDKATRRERQVKPDFVGFTVSEEFLVGFGLDYEEQYRELPYIGVLR